MKAHSTEFCHTTWNPLPGECMNAIGKPPAACKDYCYMERMYRQHPEMRHPIRRDEKKMKWSPVRPQIVFAFSRIDFLHPGMNREWQVEAIAQMAKNEHVTYVVVSKFPQQYSEFTWPINCWMGTTVDGLAHTADNLYWLMRSVPEAKDRIRFVFFEPLLAAPSALWLVPIPPLASHYAYIPGQHGKLSWVVVGANSNEGAARPLYRYADAIVSECRRMKIPVLVKDNYRWDGYSKEMPPGWAITKDGLVQTQKPQLELF